jgi:hypothetical protein
MREGFCSASFTVVPYAMINSPNSGLRMRPSAKSEDAAS